MCLAVPGEIVRAEGREALVDMGGVRRRVRLDTLPDQVQVGDWVLVHTGFAIRKVPPAEARETWKLLDQFIAANK